MVWVDRFLVVALLVVAARVGSWTLSRVVSLALATSVSAWFTWVLRREFGTIFHAVEHFLDLVCCTVSSIGIFLKRDLQAQRIVHTSG